MGGWLLAQTSDRRMGWDEPSPGKMVLTGAVLAAAAALGGTVSLPLQPYRARVSPRAHSTNLMFLSWFLILGLTSLSVAHEEANTARALCAIPASLS
jgi:uncharacterized membrane protein